MAVSMFRKNICISLTLHRFYVQKLHPVMRKIITTIIGQLKEEEEQIRN